MEGSSKEGSEVSQADFFDIIFVKEIPNSMPNETRIKADIARYKDEQSAPMNPLNWQSESLLLAITVALNFLQIPASSVPSERVFPTAGNILTKQRGTLTPDNVDILKVLHHNYDTPY